MQIKPIKHFGQNFLINKRVISNVINGAKLLKTDSVLEIGPGKGALTKELVKRVKKVIAVEKDQRLVDFLKEELKDFDNIKIIYEDILKISNFQFPISKVVANLPFYIVAPVIRKFLENPPAGGSPKEMTLIVQKEVAQRICAKPPRMSILAVSVQFYATAKVLSYISKRSFKPVPKVDSAIIQITPKKKHDINPDKFFKIVKAGFSQPRKQLINNLSKELEINKEELSSLLLSKGIKPTQRAETLSVEDWLKLTKKGGL
ncbi:ribosomal RNA small subunit methyltransferase A [Patescibacteria group bacterium]|nr:ribosomal RNA small subunit methyltransferase A [Patescibacteria group bacterium]